jgi:hypothetical protein
MMIKLNTKYNYTYIERKKDTNKKRLHFYLFHNNYGLEDQNWKGPLFHYLENARKVFDQNICKPQSML